MDHDLALSGQASIRTFHVPELLEMLLLKLPPAELYRNRRVCKLWRDLMQTSSKLRRAMFVHTEEAFAAEEDTSQSMYPQ